MGFKQFMSINACKGTRWLLRKLKRGGTMFPGSVALKFDKEILSQVSEGVTTIVVAGTNGKTTTALMLAEGLRASGYDCFSNSSGANMFGGICAEYIMNTDKHGKPNKKLAVIECDEGSLKYVVPRVKPAVVLVTNVFRDQLDRYGEVLETLRLIKDGIKDAPGTLVLNGDCSLITTIGEGKNSLYYGFDIDIPYNKEEVNDVTRCIKCGAGMEYKSHSYGHLGDFYCPDCGYCKPHTEVGLTSYQYGLNGSKLQIRMGEELYDVDLALPAVYNAYNALSAFAVFKALGIKPDGLIKTLKNMNSAFGRMETFDYQGKKIRMILVKNPTGCNRVLDYLNAIPEELNFVVLLNDKENDGTDISWIWDTDYGPYFENRKDLPVFTGGSRRDAMALRLKYAGAENITICNSYEEVFDKITEGDRNSVILPNYTCMLAMRKILQSKCGGKEFWEN